MAEPFAVRLKFQGNVLCCSAFRTKGENLTACKKALAVLRDSDDPEAPFRLMGGGLPSEFQLYGGMIELYRCRGDEQEDEALRWIP